MARDKSESDVTRICRLDAAAGPERVCPEGGCSFWEPGGAVVEGRCAFERVDLAGRPGLVAELRRLRDLLDAAAPAAQNAGAWHEVRHLLKGPGAE